jgi:hypothetical protein
MEGKSSFVFYCDWKNTFDQLDNEHSGRLIKHILAYVNDENPECDDLVINVAFANIKNFLKRDLDKWKQTKAKRAEAGKMGGRPKQMKAKKANAFSDNQSKAKKAVNVNVNVNDNDNVISFRKDIFMNELRSFANTYSTEMLREFFDYWSEHKPNGKKMRFEMEKTWDISKRLERWSKNSFGKKSKSNIENILTDLMNE